MYKVISQWVGWWGGYGAERLIESTLNDQTGWRLISTKIAIRLWLWIIPRPKLLMILERGGGQAAQ